MEAKSNEIPVTGYSCNGKTLSFTSPKIMAIVNLTPDSFFDGGKYGQVDDVLADVEEKINSGAHILDLGGASSRPGAAEIPADEEWKRIQPLLKEIRKRFPGIFISVDTWRAEVAHRAAGEGADIINDIGGGRLDREMFATVTRHGLIYVLMHLDGTPQTMAANAPYDDVVESVHQRFTESVRSLRAMGCDKIILDPGFGFGKSLKNNYQLLKHLNRLSPGLPVLAGLSRKSMISRVAGGSAVTALNGTTVLHTIALLNGASVLRVHDVPEAAQAIKLVKFYNES